MRVKAWPNACYIQTQQFNETSCKIFARNVLHTFGHLVVTCGMLDGDGSSLKMITFLLQHFRMLQDVAHIFPAPLHNPTMLQNVAHIFPAPLHNPTMLQNVACVRPSLDRRIETSARGVISLSALFSSRVTRTSCRLALASVRLKNAKILHLFCHCR